MVGVNGGDLVGVVLDLESLNVSKVGLVKRENVKEFIKGFLGFRHECTLLQHFVNATETLVPKEYFDKEVKSPLISVTTFDNGNLIEVEFTAPDKGLARDIIVGVVEEGYCPIVNGLDIEVDYEESDCDVDELLEELE